MSGFGVTLAPGPEIATSQRAEIDLALRSGQALTAEAREPSPYTFFPQSGILWRDLMLNYFVDLEPDSGIRDFECGTDTYDGHRGHDALIASFAAQAIGVPVFAVLDGVVVAVHDGEPDENTRQNDIPANYVALVHGERRRTLYYHLKHGSVSVVPGQAVAAGTQIGLTGSSGFSNWPHLHFESREAGEVIEPSAGPCRPGASSWLAQTPVRRDAYVFDFAFARESFASSPLPLDTVPRTGTFVRGPQTVYFRFQIGNLPAAAAFVFRFVRPDGTTALEAARSGPSERYHSSWWWFGYGVDLDTVGEWRLRVSVNGAEVISAPLRVVGTAAEVTNRPPSEVAAAFEPAAPRAGDVVACRAEGALVPADPDYEIVGYEYTWIVNDAVVRATRAAARSDVLRRDLVREGDRLVCTITPTDGVLTGPSAHATVIVGSAASTSGRVGVPDER